MNFGELINFCSTVNHQQTYGLRMISQGTRSELICLYSSGIREEIWRRFPTQFLNGNIADQIKSCFLCYFWPLCSVQHAVIYWKSITDLFIICITKWYTFLNIRSESNILHIVSDLLSQVAYVGTEYPRSCYI